MAFTASPQPYHILEVFLRRKKNDFTAPTGACGQMTPMRNVHRKVFSIASHCPFSESVYESVRVCCGLLIFSVALPRQTARNLMGISENFSRGLPPPLPSFRRTKRLGVCATPPPPLMIEVIRTSWGSQIVASE